MNTFFLTIQLVAFIGNCILLGWMIVRLGEFIIENKDLINKFISENKGLLILCVLMILFQVLLLISKIAA